MMRAVLAAPILALFALSGPALADPRIVSGTNLVLNAGSDVEISIEPDAALSNTVRIGGDDACVSAVGQGGAIVVGTDGCDRDTGPVTVAVPPGMPVVATTHDGGDLHVGNIGGPLTVTLAGGGNLTAGRVGPFTLAIRGNGDATAEQIDGPATVEITGSGDLRVQRLTGPLRSVQRGSGNLAVGAISTDSAEIQIQGSGDAVLGNGTIGNLIANVSGSGDLGVSAVVNNAEAHASGGSDIKLGKVTGTLIKDASGGSDIYVGAGLASFGLGKLAAVVSNPANDSDISDVRDHIGSTGSHSGSDSGGKAAVTIIVVAALGFLIWRVISRRGGLAAMRSGAPASSAPTHPGVIAVRDTVQRLDARLARLEGYVTSREFDLQRKFRELDTH